jgi:hypothetical protein
MDSQQQAVLRRSVLREALAKPLKIMLPRIDLSKTAASMSLNAAEVKRR